MLTEAAIYLAAALIAVPVFRRLGFGAVLGYLAAGMLIGPWGLGLVHEVGSVMHFAEIGVVFLLFVIGLELKPSRLWVMRHAIFAAGSAQVVAAGLPLTGLALLAGLAPTTALLIGFGLALSSTAFVLQTLSEKHQLGSSHGRAAFGILLLQDLSVIPALALLPLLAGNGDTGESFWWQALQAAAVMAALLLGGRYLLRPLLRAVARWGNEESFTVAALLVVIGAALLMDWAELSMGLGAFLAGVLLADSEYRHELEGNINPFKGLLLGLFFISVGMSANFGVLEENLALIVFGALALVGIKVLSLFAVLRVLGHPGTGAAQTALILAQGGEFAFVLFHAALGRELMAGPQVEILIAIVIVSMLLTPALFLLSDRLGERADQRTPKKPFDPIDNGEPPVIIAGFGRVGQIIARVLQMRGITFTALDRDPEQVALVRRWGNKIYYGEPTRLEVLRAAGAAHARLLVIAMDDQEKSLRAVELARRHFPHLRILARARGRLHALHLMNLGVDFVIRETWLSSLELARQVLQQLGDSPAAARYSTDVFEDADENLLKHQLAHRADLDRTIETADAIRRDLQKLFENDPKMSALQDQAPDEAGR